MSSKDEACVATLSRKRPADGPSDDESLPRDGEPTLSEQRPLAGSNVAASVAGSVAASVADSVAASVADSVAAASVEAGFDASDLNATDPQPWAVLALDVETHGWAERPPDPYINKMHRGQFGKVRFSDVQLNLTFAHLVQVGWCAFAANGDVLRRQELCVCDAPSCQQRAIDVHGLTDLMLADRGVPLTAVLRQLAVALTRLQRDGGLLVAHAMEFDGGTLLCEYERAGCDEDAALLTGLATAGVCTMHAAAAQQQGDLVSRSEAQLRNPGFKSKWPKGVKEMQQQLDSLQAQISCLLNMSRFMNMFCTGRVITTDQMIALLDHPAFRYADGSAASIHLNSIAPDHLTGGVDEMYQVNANGPEFWSRGGYAKPAGVWYAVGSSWMEWCKWEMPEWLNTDRFVYLLIMDKSDVKQLHDDNTTEKFITELSTAQGQEIQWSRVADMWSGVEINPYSYTFRNKAVWYNSWDVASGVIWNTHRTPIRARHIATRRDDGYYFIQPGAPLEYLE